MQFSVRHALEGPQDHIKETVRKCQERRDIVFRKMNEIEGFHLTKAKGAFYAFPGFDFPVKDDKEFVLGILREKGVLVVHGTGFGWEKPDHFRMVTLADPHTLSEACEKIGEYAWERFGKRKK
jgi:alanine-synthesizing transaminase